MAKTHVTTYYTDKDVDTMAKQLQSIVRTNVWGAGLTRVPGTV